MTEQISAEAAIDSKRMSPDQAAKYMGKARGTIISWIDSGHLRATKVVGRWEIDQADLDALRVPHNASEPTAGQSQ